MTNSFINAMNNITLTENGAVTHKSTTNALVDFFYFAPVKRMKDGKAEILNLFKAAFAVDPTKALRILFYIRDARGGQGVRDVFRICLEYLGQNETAWLKKNLHLIAEYGRYDDYLCLLVTKAKVATVTFLNKQLKKDLITLENNQSDELSLLAKWLPSVQTKNTLYKKYLRLLLDTNKFGTNKEYRQNLSKLRKGLDILETKLADKQYNLIDYEKVPSYASLKYRSAFQRNDTKRYETFLQKVNTGEAKINASVLYPQDLVHAYFDAGVSTMDLRRRNIISNPTIEAQWKALPDFVPEINGLVVCDTSGSMDGTPIEIAMGLSIYIAERNKSQVWRNYVIPFSSHAEFLQVEGDTLIEKLKSIYTGDCSNTNLQSVFDLILDRARIEHVKAEDMPKQLLIISDMEFDCVTPRYLTNFEEIRRRYAASGYEMPNLIWWNVEARNFQVPATVNDVGCILLSGKSPAALKIALEGEFDIQKAMERIINQERYSNINY